jgi:hypothetical protein
MMIRSKRLLRKGKKRLFLRLNLGANWLKKMTKILKIFNKMIIKRPLNQMLKQIDQW